MLKPFLPVLLLACAAGLGAAFAADPAAAAHSDADLVARGRYLVMLGGCNDCHTPGFALAEGKVPESAWLTGDALGWQGAWGTTYPPNLRLRLNAMDLATWKSYAKTLKTRPPMPYWAVNAMSEADLEALWTYVHSLGPAGEPAPAALPPGVAANGPVVSFPAPPPEAVAQK
jgi:mono/diheme cytochrome c family protein